MPSPFLGMDPYLEEPLLWPGAQQGLIGGLRATLNALLPPGYVANVGERLYVVQPQRGIDPDVVIVEYPPTPPPREQSPGGTAAALADPPLVLIVEPEEVREVFIEILSLAGRRMGRDRDGGPQPLQ